MAVRLEKSNLEGIFKMKQTGSKGWYASDCPYCNKDSHLGINFSGIGSFNCFKCGERGTIYKLLKFIGRLDIVRDAKTIHIDIELENKISIIKDEKHEFEPMQKCSKPLGFKRIDESEYITGDRGISDFVYSVHEIGYSRLETKMKDYVVFLFYYQNECVGWIGRSVLLPEKIKSIEEKTGRKYLRYINSPGTDFSKYLFGINEITENTRTVFLVEGIFDKLKVDSLLQLHEDDEVKCLACFGKKVSKNQLYLMQQYNIQNIIIIYDSDAVNEAKRYAIELDRYFNVKVGFCKNSDPGDMEFDQLMEVLDDLSNPIDFQKSKVLKKKLI